MREGESALSGLLLLSVRRCFFINREKLIIERIQLRFSLKFDSKLAGRTMYDWQKMANVVCRGLVENGQSRILQRIHEGISSNWVLDIADAKSSIDHHLIHLVWRKFPRNRHSAEERRLTAVSTQTVEQTDQDSNAVLGLGRDTSADLCRPPRKILEKDCFSSADLGNLYESKNNTSCSNAGSSSDFSYSGLAECKETSLDYSPENASFMPPSKRRFGKPFSFEEKFHPELSNRFGCLEEVNSPETSNVNLDLTDRIPMSVSPGNQLRSSPQTATKLKMSEIPKATLKKSRESPLTSEIPTTTTQEDNSSSLRKRGIVKWFDPTRMRYGFITMDNKDVFFHVNNVRIGKDYSLKQGDEVSFILDEYDKGVIDVQLLPAFSGLPSTSKTVAQVESHRISSAPSVPSRVDIETRGTVKSYDRFRRCGYITVDGSCVVVPFQDDFGFGFKPGKRALLKLVNDTLGKQQATKVYPLHDEFSTTRLSETDSDY